MEQVLTDRFTGLIPAHADIVCFVFSASKSKETKWISKRSPSAPSAPSAPWAAPPLLWRLRRKDSFQKGLAKIPSNSRDKSRPQHGEGFVWPKSDYKISGLFLKQRTSAYVTCFYHLTNHFKVSPSISHPQGHLRDPKEPSGRTFAVPVESSEDHIAKLKTMEKLPKKKVLRTKKTKNSLSL